jgi:hypothetical protein
MAKVVESGIATVEGLIDALKDQHSELEVRLNDVTFSVAGTAIGLQLNGSITVSIHMRDLTDKEKDAYATANVAHLRP